MRVRLSLLPSLGLLLGTLGLFHAPPAPAQTTTDVGVPLRLSSDATLSDLTISASAFTFAPGTTSYAVAVPYAVASLTVTPTVNHAGATVTVNGVEVESGEPSAAIPLSFGETVIKVAVTAQNGTTTGSYRVTVTRAPAELALFPNAADPVRYGLVRIVNESDRAGTVRVRAFDDLGTEYGLVTLAIGAGEVRHFNSTDLETGNAAKGLTGATGAPAGPAGTRRWRLVFESDLGIRVLGYVRTRGQRGFPHAMHDEVAESHLDGGFGYEVVFFNPASNVRQVSVLRMVNRSDTEATVTITGLDDAGEAGEEAVRLVLPAGEARMLGAPALESGGDDLEGALGDGRGKWRLRVESNQPLVVMSLMRSLGGHLTNLSTAPAGAGADGAHRLWLLPAASGALYGYVRIVNASDEAGTVTVHAFDDTGTGYGPLTLAIDAGEVRHFNSNDLETGNEAKGLTGSTGAPEAGRWWRLAFESELDIRVLGYVRAGEAEEFPNAMHDTATGTESDDGYTYEVVFFNPASNANQASVLRVVNRSASEAAAVTITGTDDDGEMGEDAVRLRIPARAARMLGASDLESGGDALEGALGDGRGKWRLTLASDQPLAVMSLMRSLDGHLTNLSTAPPPLPEALESGQPNLVISAPSVSNAAPVVGEPFTLSTTVSNRGDVASASTTQTYYRSPDPTITTSDLEVGRSTVPELAGDGSSSESVEFTAPSTPGEYYYGACVDSVPGERGSKSSCSQAVRVEVRSTRQQPTTGQPNLVLGAPLTSDAKPALGAMFTLSATVHNKGDGAADATTVRFYRSSDSTISTSDVPVGTDSVPSLASSGTSSASVEVTAPSATRRYHYGACVDAVQGESDTTDNCSTAIHIDAGSSTRFNLVVGTPSVSVNRLSAGTRFSLSATVRNEGNSSSPASTIRFYRSTDATITTSDTQVGTDPVSGLAVAGSSTHSVAVTAPSTTGQQHYGACVDAGTGESHTTDNCSSSVALYVTPASEGPRPDLVVRSPYVTHRTADAGESFIFGATVHNQGDGDARVSATLRYYYSLDSTISSSDVQVGTDSVHGLAAAGDSRQAITLKAPRTAGTFYYGACIDDTNQESDSSNNCSSAVTLTVEGDDDDGVPDLTVQSAFIGVSSPEAGMTFSFGATVRNYGRADSAATTLRVYRSTDQTITSQDVQVTTVSVTGLEALSGSIRVTTDISAPDDTGTWYYGACVDSVASETVTTNNCSWSVKATVVSASPPSSEYHGAFASSFESGKACDSTSAMVAFAVDKSTAPEALNAARTACITSGGRPQGCTAFSFTQQCVAVVFGRHDLGCLLTPGHAATDSAARSDALSSCNDRDYTGCTVVDSACNSERNEEGE